MVLLLLAGIFEFLLWLGSHRQLLWRSLFSPSYRRFNALQLVHKIRDQVATDSKAIICIPGCICKSTLTNLIIHSISESQFVKLLRCKCRSQHLNGDCWCNISVGDSFRCPRILEFRSSSHYDVQLRTRPFLWRSEGISSAMAALNRGWNILLTCCLVVLSFVTCPSQLTRASRLEPTASRTAFRSSAQFNATKVNIWLVFAQNCHKLGFKYINSSLTAQLGTSTFFSQIRKYGNINSRSSLKVKIHC